MEASEKKKLESQLELIKIETNQLSDRLIALNKTKAEVENLLNQNKPKFLYRVCSHSYLSSSWIEIIAFSLEPEELYNCIVYKAMDGSKILLHKNFTKEGLAYDHYYFTREEATKAHEGKGMISYV